jgi:hypothetical protein
MSGGRCMVRLGTKTAESGRCLAFLAIALLAPWSGWAAESSEVLLTPDQQGTVLGAVEASKRTFNPSLGQSTTLSYELKKDAAVTVQVYDPDQDLVVALADEQPQKSGKVDLVWDGKDETGKVVPNEAFFFTIEAETEDGRRKVYDPTVFSGGVEQDLTEASIDREAGTILYRLPEMSRVRIRLGIGNGPLLSTLVDWEPRPAGQVTEYWDGKDRDGLVDLAGHPRFKMIISYFDLPQNSVIAYGNKGATYLEYKKGVRRTKKEERPWLGGDEKKRSRHFELPRAQDRSPELVMTFPQRRNPDEPGTIPELQGKTVVHVELDEASKRHFQDTKFEIVFFLDGEFYAEEEVGYSPYNWVWDTSQAKEGEYVLTVNLSGFQDQIGILSRKVKVVK